MFAAISSKLPLAASTKHLAEGLSGAFLATANRKNIPKVNTVIDASTHYMSGGNHIVGGRTFQILAGPKTATGRPGFLMAQEPSYQLDKFHANAPGHREGPANALMHYTRNTAIVPYSPRSSSTGPSKFKSL